MCRRCDGARTVPRLGARGRTGPRRLGWPHRGRASSAQAPQRPRPRAHGLTSAVAAARPARRACRRGARPHLELTLRARTRRASARSTARAWSSPRGRTRRAAPTVVLDLDLQPPDDPSRGHRDPALGAVGRSAKPCSTAFCSSSVSTIASGVATSDGQLPNEPSRAVRTGARRRDLADHRPEPVGDRRRSRRSRRTPWLSVSCTIAIEPTRRTASSSAAGASGLSIRRAWSRSSAATVCRLFFTRWWISRIVASLVISSRSRLRRSVTSRSSTSAPMRSPCGRSGMRAHDQRTVVACRPRCRAASRPPSTALSVSSSGRGRRTSARVVSASVEAGQVAVVGRGGGRRTARWGWRRRPCPRRRAG